MIAVNSIANRLLTAISSDPVLVNSGFKRVTLGDPVWPDRILGPMVAVQLAKSEIKPNLMGNYSGSWAGKVSLNVFHADVITNCDAYLTNRLMMFQDRLCTIVSSNIQLDGMVDTLDGIDSEWAQYDPFSTDIAQVRVITLHYTARG